ncbi:unnamed protein product [Caenorhabditis nigoni]
MEEAGGKFKAMCSGEDSITEKFLESNVIVYDRYQSKHCGNNVSIISKHFPTFLDFFFQQFVEKVNDEKKTFINVEYEYPNSTHHAQISMHKDEFAEIRGDLNSSRIVDLLKSEH